MAIGSGSMLPLLTSISTSARAGSVAAADESHRPGQRRAAIARKNRFMQDLFMRSEPLWL